jgi:membrane-associated phospholipid phosphatase
VGGALEVVLVVGLWIAYSLSRLVASAALIPARDRAEELLAAERRLGLAWEAPVNHLVASSGVLGTVSSYWYAAMHYVVTGVVLVWLFRRGSGAYLPARRALALATVLALVAYLLLPTAPPRFVPGFVDVLHRYAAHGWWSADASAPRGLGGLTNELAAFPSLHAGWALWVALVVHRHAGPTWLRAAGWAYALATGLVVVGTGNHWVLDVLGGWFVMLVAWVLVDRHPGRWPPRFRPRRAARAPCAPPQDPSSSTSAAGSP